MRNKRKKAPLHLDAAKRNTLTWCMGDDAHDNLIDDDAKPDNTFTQQPTNLTACHSTDILQSSDNHEIYQIFLAKISGCSVFLTINNTCKEKWLCELGTIEFIINESFLKDSLNIIKDCDSFWVYINKCSNSSHVIYYEDTRNNSITKVPSKCVYFTSNCSFPSNYLSLLNVKELKLVLSSLDLEAGVLFVKVFLLRNGLSRLQFPSQAGQTKKIHKIISYLLHRFMDQPLSMQGL